MSNLLERPAPETAARNQPSGTAAPASWVAVLVIQGLYYLVTGVWPWVSMATFQMVTGPKTDNLIPRGDELVIGDQFDHWLVKTVGILIAVIGLVLLVSAGRRRAVPEIALLAVAGAAGLTAVDVIYVARQVIAPVYLLDAGAEVTLIGWWAVLLVSHVRG